MKKITLVALMALSSAGAYAASADVCNGLGVASQVQNNSKFVVSPFTPHCSANVYLKYDEDTTKAWVGSASAKGKSYFGGSTAGGGVVNDGACAASPCAAGDATSGLDAAASIS